MNNRQDATQTPDRRQTLADLYAATVSDYYCTSDAMTQIRDGATIMGAALHELGRLAVGTIPALMRVTAHYAATTNDADKAAILATLTAPNGAAAILARLTSDGDRLNIWGDMCECIAED